MVQNSQIDLLNAQLEAAKVERDAIDAELDQLQNGGDPGCAEFRVFNLVARRRLIGERLLAAVEALGNVGSLAPEMTPERDTESGEGVAASVGAAGQHGPDKTHHQASHAVG